MNYSAWFLHLILICSTMILIYSTEHDPLTFNPHTLEIHNFGEENANNSICEPCAIACPANTDPEINFENTYHRYRSLFIQQVVTELQQQDAITWKCKKAYKLSVLLRSKNGGKFVEFGYQVYFEKSKFESEGIVSNDFKEFKRVVSTESTVVRINDWRKNNLSAPWSEQKTTIKKWGFLWLSKIEMRYNFSSRILKSLKYKVRAIESDQHKMTCYDHKLYGTRYNIDHNLNKLYEYDNQRVIFTKVKIPEGSCKSDDQFGECFKKHNLVLPYQFQTSSPDTISCSNMTSIPLWNEIPNVLMYRMQMFIIAVAQVLDEKHGLIVVQGVLGQLTLPSIEDSKPIKIYLNAEEKKVPVPKTIYNLVRYQASCKGDENTVELCWFDVIIVIHNYASYTKDERLCPSDQCEKMGWQSVQYLNLDDLAEEKSSFVYCCELNKITSKSIGFSLDKTRNAALNLRGFSVYDHSLKRHKDVKILNHVQEQFKKLVDLKDE